MKSVSFDSPLSDEEYSRLVDFCEEHAPLGMDGLMGLLHAVAVAPGLMPPSSWFNKAVPDKSLRNAEKPQEVIGLVLRCYNAVLSAQRDGVTITPDENDADAWELFARGYVEGALLDSEWIGDDDRWTFAAPFAYLSGRRDLVPEGLLSKMESEEQQQDVSKNLRRQMDSLIVTTDESFTRVRREAIAAATAAERIKPQSTRVGRNEPCPCGSGKKFKKCCGATKE